MNVIGLSPFRCVQFLVKNNKLTYIFVPKFLIRCVVAINFNGVPDTNISLKGISKTIMTTATAKKTNGKADSAKMEVKKQEPSKVENPILSLEKRIQKVEELNIVIDKWRKLGEAKKNLNGFQLGSDGLSSTVVIKDVSGQEFKTSHNIVVETVLKTVQEVLDAKIAQVEQQINFVS